MKRPIFVRPLSNAERETLEAGLRSPDAFTLRRCQVLLASDRGENAYQIARSLGCNPQTARNAIHAFNNKGLPQALRQGSKRPHTVHRAFQGPEQAEALRELSHHKPREYRKDTSLWTLSLAAEVSFEEGLTEERITGETIRATLARMGVCWERAKRWITSPDPEYVRKKAARPIDQPGRGHTQRETAHPRRSGPPGLRRASRGGEPRGHNLSLRRRTARGAQQQCVASDRRGRKPRSAHDAPRKEERRR
jgi:transposase